MHRDKHTAYQAAMKITMNMAMCEIPGEELDYLKAMIEAELRERDQRNPDQFNIWTAVGDALQEQF